LNAVVVSGTPKDSLNFMDVPPRRRCRRIRVRVHAQLRTTQAGTAAVSRRPAGTPDPGCRQAFATKGVAATKILHVTEAAGVSNGIFYHYFANKNELQAAVGEVVVRDLIERLATVQETCSYRERVALGAVGTMAAIASEPELGAIMTQYSKTHSKLRVALRSMSTTMRTPVFRSASSPLMRPFRCWRACSWRR
jgi:hypothetical protein